MPQFDPRLLESAPLARRMAPQLCPTEAAGGGCAWIHGFWQYLRLLGLASTPGLHAAFFGDQLLDGAAAPRILISGAADYSMLDVVASALRRGGRRADITVVDRCETPLMLNRWFAEREGLSIATVRRDIFDFAADAPFDVICTHSFLSEIPAERWPSLLGRWRGLLRPGGIAITVNRVRSGDSAAAVGFTEAQAAALRAAALEIATSLGAAWPGDPRDLARQAETYMSRRRTYAPCSRDDVARLFEGAGFRLKALSCGPVTEGVRSDLDGPTLPGSADYARIAAVKA